MKILLVIPHFSFYGGAETVIVKFTSFLRKNKIKHSLLTLSLSDELKKVCDGTQIITPKNLLPFKLRSTSFIKALGSLKEIFVLWKLVHRHLGEFDIINFHNFPTTWALFPTRKPSVWMCNEPPDLWNNPNPSFALRVLREIGYKLDKIIVNQSISAICVADEFNKNRVYKRYGRDSNVMYYGIDYNFYANGDANKVAEKYNIKGNFVLLQVGLITPTKNQMESVKAVNELKNNIPNIKLILAGMHVTPYIDIIKNYIKENKLENHVIFTGHIGKEEVRNLYKACDVALFPTKLQGGWLSPFEALCAEKPIVVSKAISSADIIEKEKVGIVSNNIVKSVKKIYNNKSFYLKTTKHGGKWVKDNLNWDNFSQKMLDVFEKVLKK